jgi:hypothetical protein
VLAIVVLAITGCASSGGTAPPAEQSSIASAVAGQGDLAAPPSSDVGTEPSSGIESPAPEVTTTCTTHSCVVQVAEASLPGTQAKDGSVMTKAACYSSTVVANPGNTYTVKCDVTYSDGDVWAGFVTWILDGDQVSWEPQTEVS